MKNFMSVLAFTSATSLAATGAMAQSTTQNAVLGASSDAVYSVRVEGGNGVIYNCKPELTTTASGQSARECIREEDAGSVFAAGDGISNGAPAIALVFVAAAVAGGGSSSSATTTESSDN